MEGYVRKLIERAELAIAELEDAIRQNPFDSTDIVHGIERIERRMGQISEQMRVNGVESVFSQNSSENSRHTASVSLRQAGAVDVPHLAQMNKQLIVDEGSANPMGLAELRERIEGWLAADWRADWIVVDGRMAGYALYREQPIPYREDDRYDIFLRQYFIVPDWRGTGIAAQGIETLIRERFDGCDSVLVNVLESNIRGRKFWAKTGFLPEVRNLRRRLQTQLS